MALALVGAAAMGGCDPVPFASVELVVRTPESASDRMRPSSCDGGSPSCIQLSRLLDGGALEALTLTNTYWGPTEALPLGREQRTLELEIFTGDPTGPTLLARADPVRIPAIDDEGSSVTLERTAVLAAYDAVEALFDLAPAADASGAACDDAFGNAWFFGAQSWSMAAATLEPRLISGVEVQSGAAVACAGSSEPADDVDALDQAQGPVSGRFFAFVGDCAGGGGGTLLTGADSVSDSTVVSSGNGCNPRVAMRDGWLWVVQDNLVTVHDVATLTLRDALAISPPALPFVDAIVRSDGSLVVAEAAGATRLFTLSAGNIVETPGPNGNVAALVDRGGAAWALTKANDLVHMDIEVEDDEHPDLGGLTDVRDVVALRDGTVIALGTIDDDGTAVDAVAVAGAGHAVPTIAGHGRTALTRTVGGAVLLWGVGPGVDVFVPSAPVVLAARALGQ